MPVIFDEERDRFFMPDYKPIPKARFDRLLKRNPRFRTRAERIVKYEAAHLEYDRRMTKRERWGYYDGPPWTFRSAMPLMPIRVRMHEGVSVNLYRKIKW